MVKIIGQSSRSREENRASSHLAGTHFPSRWG